MQSFRQYRQFGEDLRESLSMTDYDRMEEDKKMAFLRQLGVEQKEDKYQVSFAEGDPMNPKNWSKPRKWATTATVGMTGFLVGWSSAVDSTAAPQIEQEFGVSDVTESLATALFLIAFGCGSLIAGPMSETVGRNPVYLGSLLVFMIWLMAPGLSPNIAAQLVFRFLAGFFGCTPLTTFGGSAHDMWNDKHRTYVFPVMAALTFIGPFMAPMVGAFIGQNIDWRWTEWTTLIMAGVITITILLFAQETYEPILLEWKASQLRKLTGDERFVVNLEAQPSFLSRLKTNIVRPFEYFFTRIIVTLWCLYVTLVYVVLFTFLPGYTYIFEETYDFGQGTTGLMYIGLNVGFLAALAIVPFIYYRYKRHGDKAGPETRLDYAMIAAPILPLSLFWMAWTARSDISYWSPLVASAVFGFAMQGIFISAYQYLIDTFKEYAASALVSLTLTRYVGAGAMTVVANPMYKALHVEWTLTLLGCVSVLFIPVPYLFYVYGAKIRARST